MSSFAVGGGKVDQEGFLKFLLLMFRAGYAQGLNVTQRGAGANMSVDVNLSGSGYGGCMMVTSANVPYFGWIDATTNVTVTAADPTNPRIDTVVAYVDLSVLSTSITNNVGAFKFKAVTGTPAGSPSAPNSAAIQSSIGAGNPYVPLANLAVAAAASSIVNANITDGRLPMAFQVGYLYGGSSNTSGHLVPNVADDTVALLNAVQNFTNKNSIASQSASHLSLVAGTNKLVRSTVLRQDDTTNTYQPGNTVTLTGWGVITAAAANSATENVVFGVTFLQRPIVNISYGGDHASAATYGSGGANIKKATPTAHTITTTGFTALVQTVDGTNWSAGNTVFYQWRAEGEI